MDVADFSLAQHRVPPGYRVVDEKQCENCSRVFVRDYCSHNKTTRCACVKYCPSCRQNLLLPCQNEIGFQEGLVTGGLTFNNHPIQYDDSLLPVKKTRMAREQRRNDWMGRLLLAFGANEALTALEISQILGLSERHPNSAVHTARAAGFVLTVTRDKKPYSYKLEEVIAVKFKFGRPVKDTAPESIYL